MTSIGKVEYRIKDEFTGFYIGKILFDTGRSVHVIKLNHISHL